MDFLSNSILLYLKSSDINISAEIVFQAWKLRHNVDKIA